MTEAAEKLKKVIQETCYLSGKFLISVTGLFRKQAPFKTCTISVREILSVVTSMPPNSTG